MSYIKKNNIEWSKEIIQAGSDVAELAKGVGIPGVGLVTRFIQHFYSMQLRKKFEKFISDAGIDEQLLSKVSESEAYSDCSYGILEAIRQTHSRTGFIALALVYKERQSDETYLIVAMQAFSQVGGVIINAFISLYESIPEDKSRLTLKIQKGDESHFHNPYNEAVELIRKNFFVMSTGAGMHSNESVQGMKWDHTDSYCVYCRLAEDRV